MINNPYIDKVRSHNKILIHTEEIYTHKGNWNTYFKNDNPVYLEIGTGMGNFFSKQVIENPEINFVGIELKFKRLFNTAEKSLVEGNDNFLVLKDFGQNIDKIFEKGEIERCYIYFPDPWGKKDRQKKHRLLQKEFLENLHSIIKIGGSVVFKTDHREYFDTVIETIKGETIWNIDTLSYDYEKEIGSFDTKNITEFEAKFRRDKMKICYVILTK